MCDKSREISWWPDSDYGVNMSWSQENLKQFSEWIFLVIMIQKILILIRVSKSNLVRMNLFSVTVYDQWSMMKALRITWLANDVTMIPFKMMKITHGTELLLNHNGCSLIVRMRNRFWWNSPSPNQMDAPSLCRLNSEILWFQWETLNLLYLSFSFLVVYCVACSQRYNSCVLYRTLQFVAIAVSVDTDWTMLRFEEKIESEFSTRKKMISIVFQTTVLYTSLV